MGLLQWSTPSTQVTRKYFVCFPRRTLSYYSSQAAHHQRMSMTSSLSLALRRRGESTVFLTSAGTPGETPLSHYHPAPSRNEVAVVQPVLVSPFILLIGLSINCFFPKIKHVEGDLLMAVNFVSRGILTSTRAGLVKFWVRPLPVHPRALKNRNVNRVSNTLDAQDWGS